MGRGEPFSGFRLYGGLLIGAGLLFNSVPGLWPKAAKTTAGL
jgi:hypothetical protein